MPLNWGDTVARDLAADLNARFYPDYFQDVAGIDDDRRDLSLTIRSDVRYRLSELVDFRAGVRLSLQESSLEFLDYSEFSAAVAASVVVKF